MPFDWFLDSPQYYTLGIQKDLEARLVATSATSYEAEGIKFYYAQLVGKDGNPPTYKDEFLKSGKAHADAYWDLINGERKHWDYRLVIFLSTSG